LSKINALYLASEIKGSDQFDLVDFVSIDKKLVIEVDGSQHFLQSEHDEIRTQFLNFLEYKVIRFWNSEAKNQFNAVMETIYLIAKYV
jgi:very-short-patch-repair endonuclease